MGCGFPVAEIKIFIYIKNTGLIRRKPFTVGTSGMRGRSDPSTLQKRARPAISPWIDTAVKAKLPAEWLPPAAWGRGEHRHHTPAILRQSLPLSPAPIKVIPNFCHLYQHHNPEVEARRSKEGGWSSSAVGNSNGVELSRSFHLLFFSFALHCKEQ